MRLALSKGPNRVGIFLLSPENGNRSSFYQLSQNYNHKLGKFESRMTTRNVCRIKIKVAYMDDNEVSLKK
jgi:hypothetical protein